MDQETCVQSQVTSYQRLLKWYFIPPCLTLSNIRYISKVKLLKKEPSGRPQLWLQPLLYFILLYGCTTWTLTKWLEKKLDSNYTRMLQPILNRSWRQHSAKHQLYGHVPPIMKNIQVRRTRHAGHCWRSRDELISDVLLWTPTYGRAKAGQPARTYIQQLCEDTGCSPEDLPEVMNNKEKWQERVRDICAGGMTWWWWYQNYNSKILINNEFTMWRIYKMFKVK